MSSGHYIKFYVGDYDRATKDLSALEDGIYFRLLRHCWSSDRTIKDIDTAYRIAGAFSAQERIAVNLVIDQFFTKGRAGYVNSRAQKEREERDQILDIRRECGSKGGRPKTKTEPNGFENKNQELNKNETKSLSKTKPFAKPFGSQPDPELEPDPTPNPEPARSVKKAAAATTARARDGADADASGVGACAPPAAAAAFFENFVFVSLRRKTGEVVGEQEWLEGQLRQEAKQSGAKGRIPDTLPKILASGLPAAKLGKAWLEKPVYQRMAAMFYAATKPSVTQELRYALKAIDENWDGCVSLYPDCEQFAASGDYVVEE